MPLLKICFTENPRLTKSLAAADCPECPLKVSVSMPAEAMEESSHLARVAEVTVWWGLVEATKSPAGLCPSAFSWYSLQSSDLGIAM